MILFLLLAGCSDIHFVVGGADSGVTGGGDSADAGDTADSGDTGDTGDSGDSGDSGDTGDTGDSGDSADTGETVDMPDLATVYEYGTVVAEPLEIIVDWLTLGDVNGDGLDDIVVSMTTETSWPSGHLPHDLGLVSSDGSGGYTGATVRLGVETTMPMGHVTADFDGDGLADVAVGHADGVSLLWSDGATLGGRVDLVTGRIGPVAAGDVDGDGDLDLVGLAADEAVLWTNDGAGGFTEALRVPEATGVIDDTHLSRVRLVDLDSDGHLDLVTMVYPQDDPFQVNLGVGDGTFGGATNGFPTTLDPFDFQVADLDGDGAAEIVFIGGDVSRLHLGEWTGGVTSVVAVPASLPGVAWLAAGDVDGDGDVDLVAAEGERAEVLRQDPDGLHAQGEFAAQYAAITGSFAAQIMATGHVNRDACDDLVLFDPIDGFRVSAARAPGCEGFDPVAFDARR